MKTMILAAMIACAPGLAAGAVHDGVYTVPITSVDALGDGVGAPAYAVPAIEWSERDGAPVALAYRLPEDLVGLDSQEIRLTRRQGDLPTRPYLLVSEDQRFVASCDRKRNAVVCMITYRRLDARRDDVLRFLSGKYAHDTVRRDARQATAIRFLAQPVGILAFDVP